MDDITIIKRNLEEIYETANEEKGDYDIENIIDNVNIADKSLEELSDLLYSDFEDKNIDFLKNKCLNYYYY